VPFLTKSVEKPKTTVTSEALEAQLSEKLVDVAVLTDKLEQQAHAEIKDKNLRIADLESRIIDLQKQKMVALGRVEHAAAIRGTVFQVPPKKT